MGYLIYIKMLAFAIKGHSKEGDVGNVFKDQFHGGA